VQYSTPIDNRARAGAVCTAWTISGCFLPQSRRGGANDGIFSRGQTSDFVPHAPGGGLRNLAERLTVVQVTAAEYVHMRGVSLTTIKWMTTPPKAGMWGLNELPRGSAWCFDHRRSFRRCEPAAAASSPGGAESNMTVPGHTVIAHFACGTCSVKPIVVNSFRGPLTGRRDGGRRPCASRLAVGKNPGPVGISSTPPAPGLRTSTRLLLRPRNQMGTSVSVIDL
jgi:hypothetical protein